MRRVVLLSLCALTAVAILATRASAHQSKCEQFAAASVKRAGMVTGSGQWTSEPTTVLRRVPGGSTAYRQFLGRGPETATYDLAFASVDEFADFKLLQGTVDVNDVSTNQLIDEINRFDQAAVIRQAREYR